MRIENGVLKGVSNNDIKDGKFVIQEGVTAIEFKAFKGCTSLKSIIIPESVTTIGVGAFDACTSLKSIVISEGVTTIGVGAFKGCTGLESIVIPKSVTVIGNWAFKNGTSPSIIHIDADTEEEYERILKLLPPALQKTIQANIKAVVEQSVLFIAGADKGSMLRDVTATIVADLVEQYKIPSFMITKELEALRSPKETPKTFKERLSEIKVDDSAEANDENRNDDGGMRNI